jgi:hypothetical protein
MQEQHEHRNRNGTGADYLYLAYSTHAMMVLPFIRRGIGKRAYGLPAVLALILISVLGTSDPNPAMQVYPRVAKPV